MNEMEAFGLEQVLGNAGVEVCRLADGRPVVVRAMTLARASDWCRRARAAVERAATAVDLRALAQEVRTKALAAVDEEELARAEALRARAAGIEEVYWDEVVCLATEAWARGGEEHGQTRTDTDPHGRGEDGRKGRGEEVRAEELTAGQLNAVFETAFCLSDPTHAVAGFRAGVVAAVVSRAAEEVRKTQVAVAAAKG